MNDFFELCKNGVIEMINEFLRDKCFDSAAENNFAIRRAAEYGQIAVVERLLRVKACANYAIRDRKGNAAVIKRQVQVDPSTDNNYAVRFAARNGHIAVVERLLQDERVDPSAEQNDAIQWAARKGHLAVVERLLQDKRVDPSAYQNCALRWAALKENFSVVDRLLEDDRVDAAVAILYSPPEHRKRFECRERLTEICIALQDLALPAWVTIKILRAARPWSTLPLHSKWKLVCTVKHFHDQPETKK